MITKVIAESQISGIHRITDLFENGEFPSAKVLAQIPIYELVKLSMHKRFQLWTKESLDDFFKILLPVMHKLIKKHKKAPIIIEVAAATADLSHGLRKYFPGFEFIPIDKDVDQKYLNRGLRLGYIEDFVFANIRKNLGIAEQNPIIVIGSNLFLGNGQERLLLQQNVCDEVLLVQSLTPQNHILLSGDSYLGEVVQFWEQKISLTSSNRWFTSILTKEKFSDEPSLAINKIYHYSRR